MKNCQEIGITSSLFRFDDTMPEQDLLDCIKKLNENDSVHGIIVQLPLPKTIDTNAALSAIPDDKDVDGISTATGEHLVAAPVALAIVEILRRSGVDPKGKKAVVVGAGRLVGAPTAQLLKKLKDTPELWR